MPKDIFSSALNVSTRPLAKPSFQTARSGLDSGNDVGVLGALLSFSSSPISLLLPPAAASCSHSAATALFSSRRVPSPIWPNGRDQAPNIHEPSDLAYHVAAHGLKVPRGRRRLRVALDGVLEDELGVVWQPLRKFTLA
ncbi:hypothetical protein PG997_001651 [Apiospora hydei]|uniref:Uncharacterized protein n=1 Tax=Apiospora hydei TaxID=1337664 RepID=A0ABR1XEC2_9PEZI